MQVTETRSEGLSREFKIAVPGTEIDERIDKRLRDIAGQAQLPGFRPGKVPVSLIRKRYGNVVRDEVVEQAVQVSSERMVSEQGIRPAGRPKVEVTSSGENSDLEFKVTLDIMPEIEPIDFSTIEIEKLVIEIRDEHVQERLEKLAETFRESQPVTDGRLSEKGDLLVIDFVGKVDGKTFDGGSTEGYTLELGAGNFIPGFEEQMVGVKAGDEKQVILTFPTDYGADELAGREAVFECKVHEIREAVVPEIDDDLAGKVGKDSLDDLRQTVTEKIGREFADLTRANMKRKLLDTLSDMATFDVPKGLRETEFNTIWEQFQREKEQGKLDEDERAKSDEEHKAELGQIADRRVRLGILLSETAKLNDIDLNQEEINRALFEMARGFPGQEQKVIEFYRSNPQAMQEISGPLYENKIVDYVLELAKVTERTVSLEEMLEETEKDASAATGQATEV